jgi:hypothetical protein
MASSRDPRIANEPLAHNGTLPLLDAYPEGLVQFAALVYSMWASRPYEDRH